MTTEQHLATTHRALDAYNRGDLDAYLELYTPDAVLHGYGLEPGHAAIRAFYEQFVTAFPDGHIAIDDLFGTGDRVVCRYLFRGMLGGPLMGVPATGRRVEVPGITILRFEDGRCAERWAEADFLGMLRQIGAVPAPETAALAHTIYNHFSNGVFEQVLAHATDDVAITFVPTGQTFHGHEGFLEFMQGFKIAFPDVTLEVTSQVVAAGRLVNEFIARGTHTGPLFTPGGQIPPTGRRAEWRVCEVWTLRDGKLAALVNYQDSATLMHQLGAEAGV